MADRRCTRRRGLQRSVRAGRRRNAFAPPSPVPALAEKPNQLPCRLCPVALRMTAVLRVVSCQRVAAYPDSFLLRLFAQLTKNATREKWNARETPAPFRAVIESRY